MDELERKLLYRLLDVPGMPSYRIRIVVGQLPSDVVFTLPGGTRVLGSLEHPAPPQPTGGGMHRQDHTRIELNAPQQATSWLADFAAQLDDQWERHSMPGFHQGGFLPAEQLEDRQWYSAQRGQTLALNAQDVGDGCEVTLNLNGMSPEQMRHWTEHFQRQLAGPKLHVLSGVTVHPGGGSTSGDTTVHGALLEGAVPAPELLAHFAQQLEAQSWTAVTSTQQGSRWFAQWVRDGHGLVFITLEQLETGIQATLVLTGQRSQDGQSLSF